MLPKATGQQPRPVAIKTERCGRALTYCSQAQLTPCILSRSGAQGSGTFAHVSPRLIAYISAAPEDPFRTNAALYNVSQKQYKLAKSYEYQYCKTTQNMGQTYKYGHLWYLRACGPDRQVGDPYFHVMVDNKTTENLYDPTNGTVSYGDIYRTNKGDIGGGNMR